MVYLRGAGFDAHRDGESTSSDNKEHSDALAPVMPACLSTVVRATRPHPATADGRHARTLHHCEATNQVVATVNMDKTQATRTEPAEATQAPTDTPAQRGLALPRAPPPARGAVPDPKSSTVVDGHMPVTQVQPSRDTTASPSAQHVRLSGAPHHDFHD
eukprot:COSAG01_NODE_4161_length_5283_cov_38.647184_4_plen_159_part_00